MQHFSRVWTEADIEPFPFTTTGFPLARDPSLLRCYWQADAELVEPLARALPEPSSRVVLGEIVLLE